MSSAASSSLGKRWAPAAVLDTHLAHPILQAAGLSTLATWIVSDAIEAALTAEQIGYP